MNEQIITLDVSKRPAPSQTVRVGQGDKHGTTIVARMYDNGAALDLTGRSAVFLMRLSDGIHYIRDTNVTVSGNTATYVVDESHVAAVSGNVEIAYFEIWEGTTVISSTQRFRIEILQAAYDNASPGDSWDNLIDEIISRGNQVVTDLENNKITSATATVDNTIGTPSVDVELDPPGTLGRVIRFAFHKIKGDKGDTGPQGPKGDKGDTVSVEPITNSQIDTIVADGSVTSLNALDATGLTYLWGKLKSKFASLVNGAVVVSQGGTGATTASIARANLDAAQSNGATNTLYDAEQAIASLQSEITHTVGQELQLSGVTSGTCKMSAFGKVICVYLSDIYLSSELANGLTTNTLATVPEGYRPSYTTFGLVISTTAFMGKMRVLIGSSGAINLRNVSGQALPTSTNFSCTITYVC